VPSGATRAGLAVGRGVRKFRHRDTDGASPDRD
jgi:hypothetical protein